MAKMGQQKVDTRERAANPRNIPTYGNKFRHDEQGGGWQERSLGGKFRVQVTHLSQGGWSLEVLQIEDGEIVTQDFFRERAVDSHFQGEGFSGTAQ